MSTNAELYLTPSGGTKLTPALVDDVLRVLFDRGSLLSVCAYDDPTDTLQDLGNFVDVTTVRNLVLERPQFQVQVSGESWIQTMLIVACDRHRDLALDWTPISTLANFGFHTLFDEVQEQVVWSGMCSIAAFGYSTPSMNFFTHVATMESDISSAIRRIGDVFGERLVPRTIVN